MKESIRLRLASLRASMQAAGVNATIIPQTDPHQSEYISDHWQIRRWLSGFTGSAGSLVVTADKALLWTDSRYFIQASDQLSGTEIALMKDGLPDTPSIHDYLRQALPSGSTIGINGMVFSITEATDMRETLTPAGISIDNRFDPFGDIWEDRPHLPNGKIFLHDEKYAGQSASEKIATVLANTASQGATSTFISALDEIAWILNIRSNDVDFNPVATAFLFLSEKASVLFANPDKLTNEVRDYLLQNDIFTEPYDKAEEWLCNLPAEEKVLVNASATVERLGSALGDRIVCGQSPATFPKARKNDAQLAGLRNAMQRDGVALVKLYMEIERRMQQGISLTEIETGQLAAKFRSEGELYFDESFGPIAGYASHGAIVHYSATEETDASLKPDNLFLFDSGAQYLDGTTDITRTISLGQTTEQQRRDFTLVMKGHIAIATSIFPAGTRGAQLDAMARQYLWKEGLNYLHGTGHGVGHFLNVHEGPQNIRLNENPTPLLPGMVTSNEPGVYREGVHGIRCENLVLTVPAFTTEFGEFYKFETLTLFPFDRNLFDTSIMSEDEITWVNNYHATVYDKLSPSLNEQQKEWLKAKTAPLN